MFGNIKRLGASGSLGPGRSLVPVTRGAGSGKLVRASDALDREAAVLKNYFKGMGDALQSVKADVGLSGGYDSRLILSLVDGAFDDYQVHTNWKSEGSPDISIAREIAHVVGKDLVMSPPSSDEDDIKNIVEEAYLFYDGQFRVNHGWTRYYRTRSYRQRLLGSCGIAFSGHNGEQYRNIAFLHPRTSYDLFEFVKYYVFREGPILNKRLAEVYEYTLDKVLSCTDHRHRIDARTYQLYYATMWTRCGPGIRIAAENKICMFIAPFLDSSIRRSCALLSPETTSSGSFQRELISRIRPDLARLPYTGPSAFVERSNRASAYTLYRIPFSIRYWFRTLRGFRNNPNERRHLRWLAEFDVLRDDELKSVRNISTAERALAADYVLGKWSDRIAC